MGAIHEALCAAIAECGTGISKDKIAQGYKFRGVEQAMNLLNPIFARNGLALVPHAVTESNVIERQTKNGGAMYFASAKIEFRLYHSSGEWIPIIVWSEAMDTSDKALNKVMSVAWKYAAFQTFCIPFEDVADESTSAPDMAPSPPPSQAPQGPLEFLLGELTGTPVHSAGPGTISRYLIAVKNHIKTHPEWPRAERDRWIAHGVLCQQALEVAQKLAATNDPVDPPPSVPSDYIIPY